MNFEVKKPLFSVALIYFFSRLPFLRTVPVFYDSFEYARIAEQINFNNYSSVIISSHQPYHTFYILLILFFKKILFFFNTGQILTFISLFFGLMTVLVWYRFAGDLKGKIFAFYSTLFLLLFPYFFAVTTNIFYESPLLFFQLSAFYCLNKYLRNTNNYFLIGGGILLGFAISIFIGTVFIFPLYMAVYFLNRKIFLIKHLAVFYLFSIATAALIDLLILASPGLIYAKYLSHAADWTSANGGLFLFLYRVLRNFAVQLVSILSIPGFLFLIYGILKFKGDTPENRNVPKYKHRTVLVLLVILPFLFLSQYWHAGLFGRLGMYIIFPSAFFLTYYYRTQMMRIGICFALLLFIFQRMTAQKSAAPIYQYYDLYKFHAGTKQVAVVTSDYNRFLYQKNNIPLFVINGIGNNLEESVAFIDRNLEGGNQVVIDSAAISYPYYQYDGEFFHPLSQKRQTDTIARRILGKYESVLWAENPNNRNIYFLKLTTLQMAARIRKIKSAYDRTDTNTSIWRSDSPYSYSGLHRLADFPDPV